MKTFATAFTNAVTKSTRRATARIKLYKSRNIATALWDDDSPAWARDADDDEAYPQSPLYVSDYGGFITMIVVDGLLCALYQGSSPVYPVTAVAPLDNTGISFVDGYVFFSKSDGLYRVEIDMSNLSDGFTGWVGTETKVGDYPGTPCAISGTELCAVTYYNGGARFLHAVYTDGAWVLHYSTDIVFDPQNLADETLDSFTFYSTAVKVDDEWHIYMKYPTGAVWGVKYNTTTDAWSDIVEAIPADLSEFRPSSAFYLNSRVWLCGRFRRNSDIETQWITLLCHSADGTYFSLDQFCLASSLQNHFWAVYDATYIYLLDTNRITRTTKNYWQGNLTDTSTYTVKTCAISENQQSSSANVSLAAGNEAPFDDVLFTPGSVALLDIGYMGSTSYLWENHGTYVIDDAQVGWADGIRAAQAFLQNEPFWRLSSQVAPYYTELIGKSAVEDNMLDYTNMYAGPEQAFRENNFTIDFWKSVGSDDDGAATPVDILDNGGVNRVEADCPHTLGIETEDVLSHVGVVEYPTQEVGETATASLYMWCRSSAADIDNDAVTLKTVVVRGGIDQAIAATKTSTYDYPPRTYPTSAVGSYPIVFDLNLEDDDQIKAFRVILTNVEASGTTVFCLERITVEGVMVNYDGGADTWPIEDITTIDPKNAGATPVYQKGMVVPDDGSHHVMLTSTPYQAYNFRAIGEFVFSPGDEYSTLGKAAVGVAFFYENASNMCVARYEFKEQTWQIVLFRNGVETYLATQVDTTIAPPDVKMLVEHRHGNINIYRWAGGSAYEETPILTYSWDHTEPMSRVPAEDLKIGVYGWKRPPYFRISSFDPKKSTYISLLPNNGVYTHDNFNNFPDSGKCVIDKQVYTYASKLDNEMPMIGPYQVRSMIIYEDPYSNGGNTFVGPGIDIRYFDYDNAIDDYADAILTTDAGYSYKVTITDWNPYTELEGEATYLLNRSRHFCPEMPEGILGLSCRGFLSKGLAEVTYGDDDAFLHTMGTPCFLYTTEKLSCVGFSVSNNDPVFTIKDMITKIAAAAGVPVDFPGDTVIASQELFANTELDLN